MTAEIIEWQPEERGITAGISGDYEMIINRSDHCVQLWDGIGNSLYLTIKELEEMVEKYYEVFPEDKK